MDVFRGEIWFADLGENNVGSEQNGVRPVLIIQNDIGNLHSPTTIACLITSKIYKATLPTHVYIECLEKPSLILCEQIRTIDKSRLLDKVLTLTRPAMRKVERAILVSLGLGDNLF
ncbi:MAG: type II toxin-antitoxin system PemK/MazF family toxin [Christensenellaceae bacterium]|jgi:mRNA interferase MazF|nr:type II toxin-antitoxin system PemK/MazF family toxin [Christensenellaceae bacterium]